MLIALADPTLRLNPGHTAWQGASLLVFRTAEEAENFLELNALDKLLLLHDLEDAEHILSLVNYLVAEGHWAHAQIELIEVVAETEAAAVQLITSLREAGYKVAWRKFDHTMFELNTIPDSTCALPVHGWNGMLREQL